MTTTVACHSNSPRRRARERETEIRKKATPSNINHVKASLGDENLSKRLSLGTADIKQQATKSLVLRMEWEKRRPSRKCLHLYMQLSEALSENATAKRSFRRLRVEAHDNWAMRPAAAKTHNTTLLWKHIEQSPFPSPSSLPLLFCSCFCTAEPPTDVGCEPNTWSAGWQGCAKDTNARHLFQRCHPYNSSKKPIFAGTLRCFPVAANVASKCCRKQSSATLD